MKSMNFNNVAQAPVNSPAVSEGKTSYVKAPVAGAYLMTISTVTDKPNNEALIIAVRDDAGWAAQWDAKFGKEPLTYYRSYKEKAAFFMKKFCEDVSGANDGYIFDCQTNCDEQTLVGKKVYVLIGEEEYYKRNGQVGSRPVVKDIISKEQYESKNYVVPAKKTVPQVQPAVQAQEAPKVSLNPTPAQSVEPKSNDSAFLFNDIQQQLKQMPAGFNPFASMEANFQ